MNDVGPHPPKQVRAPVMYQGWRNVAFIHRRMAAAAVQRVVPEPLQVEEFDGSAWVGLTPFAVSGARPPLWPRGHAFLETNLRTYVRAPDGHRGVWFLSLDSSSVLVAAMGRALYFPAVHDLVPIFAFGRPDVRICMV